MNRLVLIGNGFDLAHGLKTSYADFINWYKAHRVEQLGEEHSNVSKDLLCTIQLKERQALSIYAMNYIREHQLDFSHEGFGIIFCTIVMNLKLNFLLSLSELIKA